MSGDRLRRLGGRAEPSSAISADDEAASKDRREHPRHGYRTVPRMVTSEYIVSCRCAELWSRSTIESMTLRCEADRMKTLAVVEWQCGDIGVERQPTALLE